MDRHSSLVVILILGVVALLMIHLLPNNTKRESFKDENENENENEKINPHKLNLAPINKSCDNLFDRKGFVSVQEFMNGSRYRCY